MQCGVNSRSPPSNRRTCTSVSYSYHRILAFSYSQMSPSTYPTVSTAIYQVTVAYCCNAVHAFPLAKINFRRNGFQRVEYSHIRRLARESLVHGRHTATCCAGQCMGQQTLVVMAPEKISHHQSWEASGRIYEECSIRHAQRIRHSQLFNTTASLLSLTIRFFLAVQGSTISSR